MKQYKTILVGDGGVGKTTYLTKLLTDEFRKNYVATLGVEVRPVVVKNTTFNVWDCAGQEKFSGLKDGYYIDGKCAIIMFCLDSELTYRNAMTWYREVVRSCGKIPIVFVGSKSDVEKIKVIHHPIYGQRLTDPPIPDGCDYVEISTKNGDGLNVPFELLLNKLQ